MKQLLTSKLFGVVVTGAMIGAIALSLLSGSLTCAYAAGIPHRPPEHMFPPKGKVYQSPAFLRAKNAHQVNPLHKVLPESDPSSFTLPLSYPFKEPLAYGYQDSPSGVGKGAYYTDEYNWYDCGPGAATVAMWFWAAAPFPGAGTYRDPHSSLYWLTTNGRPDIMYIAYVINPPNSGWTSPGVMTYGTYPSAGTNNTDEEIGMNYEASGESSTWETYYYVLVPYNSKNFSASALLSDIEYDTYTYRVPPVVSVNQQDLPDWNKNGINGSHDVAILGYNNSNSTYTYYETCGSGAASCSTSGTGTYTISQSQLYTAIENDNGYGGLIW